MRALLSFCLLINIGFALPAFAATKTLTVYTYDSFAQDWGPGPKVKQAFEQRCDCQVNFITAGDGVALLNRLRLEGKQTRADIVLGLDTNLAAAARATNLLTDHGLTKPKYSLPIDWEDSIFVPYDYGYFSVLYDSETVETPPRSMDELINGDPNIKIAIQDPRTSTPGLGLLLWIKHIYKDEAPQAWTKLSNKILTVTPGWSEAYALFTAGEAPMVLSYTTSPAYHQIVESSTRYRATPFAEGHYLHVELAAITTKGKQNPLAEQFMAFVISPAFQDIIPETNWMFPAAATSKPLNPVFKQLIEPAKTLVFPMQDIEAHRKTWIAEWQAALR